MAEIETPDLILHNGRFTTLDRANPMAERGGHPGRPLHPRRPRRKTSCRWPAPAPA